jgi:hypothetical protein
MKTNLLSAPLWSTASFGDAADTSPLELSDLGEHLQHCSARSGLWARLRCAAESMNGFVSTRLVTTLGLLSLLILLPALLL